MTGGSLGLRTGSYGSLQQHFQNSVAVPIQPTPSVPRKSTKMLVSGWREKERFLPWIFKIAGRRRVGMLLLVMASVIVFITVMSAVSKDDDSSVSIRAHQGSPSLVQTVGVNGNEVPRYISTPLVMRDKRNKGTNISYTFNPSSETEKNKIPPPFKHISIQLYGHGHPCDSFALPPPPIDKKRTGPRPCPVCYIPVEQAMVSMPDSPSISPVLRNLTYIYEENPVETEGSGGSVFGGYQSLEQRNESFNIRESMNVYCGFVKGSKPGHGTGFDIADTDLLEMEKCRGIVVASAIFGNYDIIQQPKNISDAAKKYVCFYMFVDEETLDYMKNSSAFDGTQRVGLWRIIVVQNLPYADARRNGKIPKLLLHRIFPNARFSIWIDGKLDLVVDPYQILERFLWRRKATFAISRHYRRFDVFEEAEANKAAGKYDNASIDYQVEFYRKEGLTPYSPAKLPITSDVPEGCVIIREHIPITNLFTCLWFNEVDRFTSRDQISFSTVRDRIMSQVNWSINMFLDCERRNFVVQAYHKDMLDHMVPAFPLADPPPFLIHEIPLRSSSNIPFARFPPRKVGIRRGKERRSSSRRHRPRVPTATIDKSFI